MMNHSLRGARAGRASPSPPSSSSSSSSFRRGCSCPPLATRTPPHRSVTASASAAPNQAPPAPSAAPPADIVRLPPQVVAAGGLDLAREPAERVRDFSAMLQAAFVPMDLAAFPGTRVLNVDPPVLAVDDFLPAELCDRLRSAAEASGRMRRSRVGGADSPSGGGVSDEGIRTSTTLAIGREALAASPELDEALSELLGRAEALFGGGGGDAGATPQQQQQQLRLRRGLFSKPSSPGELVAEMPQVARYLPGQHFLAHEDAFPPQAALQRGFQRRATLLVYLNDVSEGGRTRFEHLGPLDVEPKKGRAAVFFPAFRGGRPDARTLHTATDAAEGHEKWVFQLWLTSAVAGGGSGASGGGQAAAKAGGGGGGVVSPLLPPRGGGGGKSKGGKAGGKAKRR